MLGLGAEPVGGSKEASRLVWAWQAQNGRGGHGFPPSSSSSRNRGPGSAGSCFLEGCPLAGLPSTCLSCHVWCPHLSRFVPSSLWPRGARAGSGMPTGCTRLTAPWLCDQALPVPEPWSCGVSRAPGGPGHIQGCCGILREVVLLEGVLPDSGAPLSSDVDPSTSNTPTSLLCGFGRSLLPSRCWPQASICKGGERCTSDLARVCSWDGTALL